MRFFLWLVILFATAAVMAVAARFNPGNVVLFYPPYRVDLSLNLFLLALMALFIIVYFVLAAIRTTRQLPRRVAAYRQEKTEREANHAFRESLKALFEGRFGHAEKAARRAVEHTEIAGLASLVGARAAHRIGQPERRDQWLARIPQDGPLKTARLMTTIELLVDEEQPELALQSVSELNASGTRHIHALRLALKASQRAGDWPEVLRLVRLLDKRKALHPALSKRLRELAYQDLLSHTHQDAESVRRIWTAIPAQERLQPFVAIRAASAFNSGGAHADARQIVEAALAAQWDDRLVRAYRESAAQEGSAELLAQIERCENWMQQRPADAELELTLGALCLKQKLWGKAQRHLEQALSDSDSVEGRRDAHLLLASLHEALGQEEQAAMHYRKCALQK